MRSWRHVVGLALLLAGCGENDNPETSGYWIDRLEQRKERVEALKNLGRLKDPASLPHLLEWLKKDGDWQPDAAYAVAQLGDKSAIPELVGVIDFGVRAGEDHVSRRKNRLNASVLRGLALLGATSEAATIKRLLQSPDDGVREAALGALGQLGDPANVPPIVELVGNDPSSVVRLAAITALGELGDPKGVPALIGALYTILPDADFYAAARHALIRVGEPAVPDLVRALERKHGLVESMKLPDGKRMPDGAIEARAASTLGALRAASAEGAMTAALGKLLERGKKAPVNSPLRAAVVELAYALGNLGTTSAANALLPLVRDSSPDLRLAGCEALITTGNRAAVKDLLGAARSGNTAARAAAIVAASRLGGPGDLAAFETLTKAGDKGTPNDVMEHIVTTEKVRLLAAKDCGADAACWRKKLADLDGRVRERAAYELGWLGAKDAVSDLLKTAEDPEADVRMAAVLSLQRLPGVDAAKLQALYDQWQAKLEYAGVNQELLKLIARAQNRKGK